MDRTDVTRAHGPLWGVVALLGGIAVFVGIDLASDYGAGTGWAHIAVEGAILGGAIVGIALLLRELGALRRRAEDLQANLRRSRAEAERWQAEAQDIMRGLGQAIDRQFDRWELTPAEKEVALLLLKGLSHKAIAELRGVSDRTVRQQAHAVYGKGGLDGRADLAAFFLEDLLLPMEHEESGGHLEGGEPRALGLPEPPG